MCHPLGKKSVFSGFVLNESLVHFEIEIFHLYYVRFYYGNNFSYFDSPYVFFGLLIGSYGQKIKTDFYRRKVVILEKFVESREKIQKELLELVRELMEDYREHHSKK
ncbi:hypothetical protein P3G55_24280 [Leptospira sp. 96542]|nr:hypothetical protein [Leptospira sp. 96542]